MSLNPMPFDFDPTVRSLRARAFTLVELIVVITILAILATVGFLALQGYTKDAKDSAIKTNLRTVAQAVSTQSATDGSSQRKYIIHQPQLALSGAKAFGTLLVPGPYRSAGTNYSAGFPDFPALKLDGTNFKDAEEKEFFIAAIDVEKKLVTGKTRKEGYFQVIGYDVSSGALVDGTFPTSDPTSSGGLVATASGSNVPVVAGWTAGWSSGSAPTGPFASCTGPGDTFAATTTHQSCFVTDKIICTAAGAGQIWSMCNVGTVAAWTGSASYGKFFQFARDDAFPNSWAIATVAGPVAVSTGSFTYAPTTTFVTNAAFPFDWRSTQLSTTDDPSANVWPSTNCSSGYHIPTSNEWSEAIVALVGTGGTWSYGTLIWSAAQRDSFLDDFMVAKYTGFRNGSAVSMQGMFGTTKFWSSSPRWGVGYCVDFNPASMESRTSCNRTQGISLRCIKDD